MTSTSHGSTTARNSFTTAKRAQSLNDFAIGVSLFLITLAFVFLYFPSVLAPFNIAYDYSPTAESDQASAQLLLQLGGPTDETNTIQPTCTTNFFDNTSTALCNYTAAPLTDTFGMPDHRHVNISITEPNATTPITYNGTVLARGDGLFRQEAATSVRLVSLDGDIYKLRVVVW